MDRRRAAGVLLVLAACVAYATAAPTASNHTTSLDLYDGAPEGCYYNFQHYGEGDRIMTNEPCLNCTCHNRMLMCYLRVCPFTKPIGQDCTIEKRADQCCPIVTCPDVPVDLLTSTTTSPAEYGATGLGKLEKFGCSIHGKYFPEGSKVPPTPNKPCEHCYCIRNMTTCVMQECTLHVDGCTPIYHKDVCCPVRYSCDHPEDEMPLLDDLSTTVRPTPGFLLTTTTLSPVTQMTQDCIYDGQIIRDGALIKTEKACDHCYCMKGDIVCVVQECGTPMENEGKNCTALAPREGVCCPDTYICEGDEPSTGSYETDYTTELQKLTTLSPPRRAGSEGSGYRNEPDDIPNSELPTFETETEGSGYEQATIHPTVVIDTSPDSHETEPSDDISPSIFEPNKIITTTTTEELISDHVDVTTERDVHEDNASQQPTTTSTYVSSQADESSTTKAQDEDIGSGEEDIETPHDIVPSSSELPAVEDSEPTITSEQHVATTKSSIEDESETPVKEPTTNAPIVDDENTSKPKEQSEPIEDSSTDITTEAQHHLGEDEAVESSTTFDEENHITEHDLLRTTSIPIIDENEIKSTASPVQDKTFEPHYYSTSSTNAPGFEDEISTTESQDDIIDSFEGTAADIDVHHQITMTASTPLLEEIENEKDTIDQEISHETTPDKIKSSTTSSILPTKETIGQDSLKPDLIDETLSTNIPTTIDAFENDVKPTADHQITDADDSSKQQQFTSTTSAPVFEDETKISTPGQESQETDIKESSKPQQQAPTTSAPVFDDQTKQTSLSDAMTTTKAQEGQDTEVEEGSEPQKYIPTTIAPVLYDETKQTTPSVYLTTSKTQETGFEESSEPQQYEPTTSAPVFDDEAKQTPSSDAMTPASIEEVQETDVKESSEPQEYASTTTAPVFSDETKQNIPSDSMTTTHIQEGQETGVEESSKPEQYAPTTSSPAFEDEIKKSTSSGTDVDESSEPQQYASTTSAPRLDDEIKQTTLSDAMTTAKPQDIQDKDIEDSSEPQQNVPTTTASVHDDETKQTTLSDAMTTAKYQESQDKDVEDSSEPQQHASTSTASVHDDETKQTTLSDATTTAKTQGDQDTLQESSEPDQYAPTTSAPVFEDETRISTPTDSITTSKTQESQEIDVDESPKPQYIPTTSAPVFEDETKKTTISDAMSTSRTQDGQETLVEESSEAQQYAPTTSAPAFDEETKKSTAEPDKGLNTIPSGPVEEETTESPETENYTHINEIVTIESATERVTDVTEVLTDTAKQTTLLPDRSATQEDQLKQTTDSTVKENDDEIILTETHDIDEQTTVPGDISEEATHSTLIHDGSSTKLPATDNQESSTSSIPLNTDNKEQTSDSGKPITTSTYEHSTQVSEAEDKTPEKHEITTSSPSYATVPASTTADLEENEIFNEPRIPGEGDCLLNGVTYRNESTVPNINKCRSGCRCISSIIKCDPIICSPPPEYMDNCQTTYDSLDSCCPTYVCDHKTETIPPKPHSQMSGTEAPVESPVICNGDECVLSEDKTKPVETSDLCESGSCTNENESSSHSSNIPEQHTVRHEECTGDKCTSSGSTDQLCTEENGCQASPVKPCNGIECEFTSVVIPPEQQPCTSGNCDVPVKDCSGGKCASDEDGKLEIDRECTEKSCKRKNDSELGQEPPKICSGSDCQSTDLISDGEVDLTTDDILDVVTEKTETSSTSPSTEITQSDIVSKPLLTTILPDVTTKLPNLDKDEISTYESTTSSANQEISLPYLPETTKVVDDEIGTEEQTNLPGVQETEKLEYDVTTKASYKDTESPDLSVDKESTTEAAEEIKTLPPKMDTTEQQEVTKVPQKIDSLDETIDTSDDTEQQTTQPPVKPEPEDGVTSNLEEMITKPPKIHHTGSLDADDVAISTEPSEDKNDDATTKTSAVSAIEDVTKLPQLSDEFTTNAYEEIGSTTSKSYDLDLHETTKSPQVTTTSEDTTTQRADIISAETLEPLVTDHEEITKTPIESSSVGTTAKSTDEFVTQPEITDVQDTTISPDGSDKITKHHFEEPSTESSKLFEEPEVTKLPERTPSETTTISSTEDIKTEASKPSDSDIPEVTQSSKETTMIAEDIGTETSKPLDTELQATTLSSEETENEEATKKSTITEPSLVSETEEQTATKSPEAIELTTTKIVEAETYTEPSKYDEISHGTTIPQQDLETDATVSKIKDETITESSIPDESELLGTTKSPSADFDTEETTEKVTKETDKEATSDILEPEPVTLSSEPYSVALPEMTTSKSLEDEQQLSSESDSLEKSSTSLPDTVFEITTQSMPLPDSKSTETEKTVIYEMTTRIPEQKQPTESLIESATEAVDELPIISTESPSHKEDDITTISDHDIILTGSPLDLVTKPGLYSEVTASPSKPNEDDTTTAIEIDTSISDKTVTELSKEQDTETPDEVKKTTVPGTELDEMTQKPTSTSDDNKLETEINTVSDKTTSKPSDTTDTSHDIDVITEQPETSDYPKEEEQSAEALDKKTEKPSILEKSTTESPLETDTKLPVDAEQEPERHTDKPYIHEQEPDTSEKDEPITEMPQVNELTTVTFEGILTEKATGIDKEHETTQNQDINTKPTESEDETYTKRPLHSSSEAIDTEASHTSEQSDDTELTTPTIKISVPTTEPSNILANIPTESSDTYNVDTEKETESTQKESLATEVTEQTIVESSSIKDDTEDKETQTMIPDISTVQESSTKGQSQEAETLEEDIITAKPVVTETEKTYEPTTESVEEVTVDTEVKTPEQAYEPSQPTITESAEHMTNVQDQSGNIDVVTEITATKDSDSTPTSPSINKTTEVPEAIETSTESLEMITSLPGDIETLTPKHELPEATTSGKIEDERDMQTTEIPATISDQQPVEIVTEPQPVVIDTTTKKQEQATEIMEEEFIPSKPEMYPTNIPAVEDITKSTPSPVEDASIASEQTLSTSIEPHITEEEQSATTVKFDLDKATTPKIPEIEVQTEKATLPTESPLQPEQPPVTTAAEEEEKLTTAKVEELSTASPVFDKFTKPIHKPTEAPATEQPRPIPTEEQPTDDLLTPYEEPSIPPSGTSGYGTDPDYMEEDQTFGPGTCRYGGKVYVSAQQIPRDDPCDFCFCFRSDIICLQQSCPPPIHGCHEEPISGFCCPRYECPVSMATTVNVTTTTTTTTTTLPPHFPVHSYKGSAQKRGCLIKGHTYKVGEVVRASSGPCLHCTCGGDGQMKCDPKQCTPEPMLRQMIAAAVSAKRRR